VVGLAVVEHGAAVSLFNARQREIVWLPPAVAGPVVVRFVHRAAGGVHSVDEERGVVFAEMLCRLLAWKGYQVRTQDKPRVTRLGGQTCPGEPGTAIASMC
jgi:hypothetical protein